MHTAQTLDARTDSKSLREDSDQEIDEAMSEAGYPARLARMVGHLDPAHSSLFLAFSRSHSDSFNPTLEIFPANVFAILCAWSGRSSAIH